MAEQYIELRVNRDFGDILSVYFDFLRQNLKKFTNVFLSYNGIFIVGLLISSYLLVTGFVGMISMEGSGYGIESTSSGDNSHWVSIVAGGVFYCFVLMAVFFLNYSLSSSYLHLYEQSKGRDFERREVWAHCKENIGKALLFILMLIPLFIGVFIVAVVFAIIPILGLFAQYIVQFFVTAWIGVSFFAMITLKMSVGDGFSEGWRLVAANFWKSVGVNFILGLLNGILLMVILMVPGIIIGIYTYHVVENNVDVGSSVLAISLYTVTLCLFMVLAVFAQCLSQFVNGILFYALHEKAYNSNARSKIEQIGQADR
jgi:hypothetical protein